MRNTCAYVYRLRIFAFFTLALTNICQAQKSAVVSQKTGDKTVEFFGKLDAEATLDTAKVYGILFEPVKNTAHYEFVTRWRRGSRFPGSL